MDDAERRMSECEYPMVSQRVVELAPEAFGRS